MNDFLVVLKRNSSAEAYTAGTVETAVHLVADHMGFRLIRLWVSGEGYTPVSGSATDVLTYTVGKHITAAEDSSVVFVVSEEWFYILWDKGGFSARWKPVSIFPRPNG